MLPELLDDPDRQLAKLETEVKNLMHKLASGETTGRDVMESNPGLASLAGRG
ncbi:MAG TPA: hypothetical protein VLB51_14255 [Methylomirabilota bacterium]|nr:hypothetical protein [Methylomirabilota bacterium]